ncbi:MAG: hypothetical protein HY393_02675 [Candidatus Diapherotrites archaeon]|nr:hypothetical protein [Candidatus Diapherotrites archaeon]
MQFRHVIRFHLTRELGLTYFSIALHFFALALVMVFVPVYLFEQGYAIAEILQSYLVAALTYLGCIFVFTPWIVRRGFKHSMMLSKPLLIVFMVLLYSLPGFRWPLFFIGLVQGVYWNFFWMAYHLDLGRITKQREIGEDVSLAVLARMLAVFVGPLVGAVILTLFGFNVLFLVASLILLVSSIPLFYSRDLHAPSTFSFLNAFSLKDPRNVRNMIGFFGLGFKDTGAIVLWRLALFLGVSTYLSFGFILTMGFVVGLIVTGLSGVLVDTVGKRLVLKSSALGDAFSWVLRSSASTYSAYFAANASGEAFDTSTNIASSALGYSRAKRSNLVEYTVLREVFIQLGVVCFILLALYLNNLNASILAAGIGSLLLLFF